MDKELRILMLEDSPTDAELEEHELRKSGLVFTLKVVDTREAFLKELDEFVPEIILSDYDLPTFDGLAALRIAKEKCPDVPFVLVTGKVGEEFAIEKLKEGATDYVLKGNIKRLGPVIKRALEEAIQIAERRHWEDALSESEATLRSIYESSPMLVGVVELTEDDKIYHIYDNPATARFFGIQYQGTKHKTAEELGAPSDAIHEWLVAYRQSQKQGKPVKFEYVHHTPDGPLWLSATVSVIGLSQNGRTRFSYVAEDITERKHSEELIHKSEEKFKTLFMSMSDGFYLSEIIFDDNGNLCDFRSSVAGKS